MPFLRAIAANILFYGNMAVWLVLCLPLLLGPASLSMKAVKAWAIMTMWLLRLGVGLRWEIRGLDNIPHDDEQMLGCIIASKHQSTWETFGLLPYLNKPTYILKQELLRIPLFGWYCQKVGMIGVERSKSAAALRTMTKQAQNALASGRQLIIFPEGTRQSVDAPANYKSGVAHLYKKLAVPLVPAALNSGLFWPRRTMRRYPGTVVIDMLPAIAPGREPRTMQTELQMLVEDRTRHLVAEERARNPHLPA